MAARDPTLRFSDRVADYVRHRPGYPAEVLRCLHRHAGLGPGSRVVDLGAGTGIFTAQLLEAGACVQAVEPNAEMRAAMESRLGTCAAFTSVAGRAESTGLPDAAADLVCAAQSFHWFDRDATRRECVRILRPDGTMALIWNERLVDASPFLSGYEELLRRWATDDARVDHRRIDAAAIAAFFHPAPVLSRSFPHRQHCDLAAARGRLLSSSYVPPAGDARHAPLLEGLELLFAAHQHGGVVEFLYTTRLHLGSLPRR